ncbi:MAG: dethiobiotin synthase [Gammaproteobacteria bacterium]|nr:dethiobiotin synthase [Gammaproteobacteria bacterium]
MTHSISNETQAPRGLFITGTDTGVGKTFIAVKLLRFFTNAGLEIIPRKPVESGCTRIGDQQVPEDALAMRNAVGHTHDLDQICPYPLERPLSPERAAALEDAELDLQKLQQACQVPPGRVVLIEGAGGFYSPLTGDGLNADLAQRLKLPVLLVAADRLGCINHVLLTAEAIASRGLKLVAIVLNQLTAGREPGMDNLEDLRKRVDCAVVGVRFVPDNLESISGNDIDELGDLLISRLGLLHQHRETGKTSSQ